MCGVPPLTALKALNKICYRYTELIDKQAGHIVANMFRNAAAELRALRERSQNNVLPV